MAPRRDALPSLMQHDAPLLLREHVPNGQEECGQHRACDEASRTEHGQPSERGEEHHVVWHPRFATYEKRSKDVVCGADHEHAADHKDDSLCQRSGEHQIERNRRPHNGRADDGQQRQHRHDDAPEHRCAQTEDPEQQASQRTLNQTHEQRPFEGRTRHRGESPEERLLTPISHRNRVVERREQFVAVTQKEEEQVEHQRRLCRDAEQVLPDDDSPSCDQLRCRTDRFGDSRTDRRPDRFPLERRCRAESDRLRHEPLAG